MKRPKVSVIMPSYNHEKFVAEAIQSVLDQTYQDFEIVITDDGSSDGTVGEIKKFKDPRIRLFSFEKNRGAAVAANNCVHKSKGEYIAMLSSDDVFLPDKLEKQVKFLDERPDIWAVFGYARVIDEDGKDFEDENHFYSNIFQQPNRTRFEWLNYFFYKGNCLCHPSALIRKGLYKEAGYYNERLAQLADLELWIRTCLRYEIYIMPENLIKFRVRRGEANASGNRAEAVIRGQYEFFQILNYFLEIETPEDLSKVFPEASKFGDPTEDLIPYYIARVALESDLSGAVHKNFALNVLYDLLGNKNVAEKLEKKCGFRHKDFIKLTGKHDVFNLLSKDHKAEALLNSWSWRITAPFRGIFNLFRHKSSRQ